MSRIEHRHNGGIMKENIFLEEVNSWSMKYAHNNLGYTKDLFSMYFKDGSLIVVQRNSTIKNIVVFLMYNNSVVTYSYTDDSPIYKTFIDVFSNSPEAQDHDTGLLSPPGIKLHIIR